MLCQQNFIQLSLILPIKPCVCIVHIRIDLKFNSKSQTVRNMTQSTTSNPCYRLEIALGDIETVDVYFVFEKNDRSTRIASHKTNLSSKSDVFQTMFSDEWKQMADDKDITITDATAEHFFRFLQTFYDEKNIFTKNISNQNVGEMMYLAHKYNAKHCLDACLHFLVSTLNGKNALFVMELALLYDIKELIEICSTEISADHYDILDTDEFFKCSANVLKCFLENIDEDDFHYQSYASVPFQICRACMEWANRRCNEQNIDPTKPGNLRRQLNGLFGNIPFTRMKSDEFLTFLADYADVFTVSEIKDICNRF